MPQVPQQKAAATAPKKFEVKKEVKKAAVPCLVNGN
jgi:hypothetical protein